MTERVVVIQLECGCKQTLDTGAQQRCDQHRDAWPARESEGPHQAIVCGWDDGQC